MAIEKSGRDEITKCSLKAEKSIIDEPYLGSLKGMLLGNLEVFGEYKFSISLVRR